MKEEDRAREVLALVERLRRTKTEHRVTYGFGGMIAFPDESETREVPVNPDGPEAADLIERLATPSSVIETEGSYPDNGYMLAFYDIAKMLDIGARARSPKETWLLEMRPKLLERIALAAERSTDREAVARIVDPSAWERREMYLRHAEESPYQVQRENKIDLADEAVETSLTKAGAILALRPVGAENVREPKS